MNTSKTICTTCQKRVYKLEELRVDKHVLHKGCFVCYKCKGKLSLSTFAAVVRWFVDLMNRTMFDMLLLGGQTLLQDSLVSWIECARVLGYMEI